MAASVTRLPPVPVVQLTGALSGGGIEDSAVELVRSLSRVSGGPAYFFYAPMMVRDAETAAALHTQPEVARSFRMFDSVTKAVVGIGLWEQGGSTVYDSASPADRRLLHELGTCAESSGAFLTAEGAPVHSSVTERMLAIGAEQLRAVPEVIAVPYGVGKARAVRAALRSGVVTSLVTHTSLATALLDLA
jgi:DNA-binding transcriptional regulator LsrR (DeoR family)